MVCRAWIEIPQRFGRTLRRNTRKWAWKETAAEVCMKASTIQAEARDCISFTSKRRRRVTFIEHCLERETSSVRSDVFLVMSLLTELHFEDEPHATNRACAYALPADQTDTLHAGGRSLTLPASNVNRIRFERKSHVSFVFANFTDAHFRGCDLF